MKLRNFVAYLLTDRPASALLLMTINDNLL